MRTFNIITQNCGQVYTLLNYLVQNGYKSDPTGNLGYPFLRKNESKMHVKENITNILYESDLSTKLNQHCIISIIKNAKIVYLRSYESNFESNVVHSSMISDAFDKYIESIEIEEPVYWSILEYLDDNIHLLSEVDENWKWHDVCDDGIEWILVNGTMFKSFLIGDPDWPDKYCHKVKIDNIWYYFE